MLIFGLDLVGILREKFEIRMSSPGFGSSNSQVDSNLDSNTYFYANPIEFLMENVHKQTPN